MSLRKAATLTSAKLLANRQEFPEIHRPANGGGNCVAEAEKTGNWMLEISIQKPVNRRFGAGAGELKIWPGKRDKKDSYLKTKPPSD